MIGAGSMALRPRWARVGPACGSVCSCQDASWWWVRSSRAPSESAATPDTGTSTGRLRSRALRIVGMVVGSTATARALAAAAAATPAQSPPPLTATTMVSMLGSSFRISSARVPAPAAISSWSFSVAQQRAVDRGELDGSLMRLGILGACSPHVRARPALPPEATTIPAAASSSPRSRAASGGCALEGSKQRSMPDVAADTGLRSEDVVSRDHWVTGPSRVGETLPVSSTQPYWSTDSGCLTLPQPQVGRCSTKRQLYTPRLADQLPPCALRRRPARRPQYRWVITRRRPRARQRNHRNRRGRHRGRLTSEHAGQLLESGVMADQHNRLDIVRQLPHNSEELTV